MITFGLEPYASVIDDIRPLLAEHWRELAMYQDSIPLEPDFDKYRLLCDAGVLKIYTARDDGDLIAYSIYVITQRHMHYLHRWAINDIVFVKPEHRNFGVGTGLYEFLETDLARGGPIVITTETKADHPELAGLLLSRGHSIVGTVLSKRL